MREDVILVIEIGCVFLKGLLLQKNWLQQYKVYNSYKIESGLFVNNSMNFENFKQQLQKFIYFIEYDSGEKIVDVIILLNGLKSEFTRISRSLFINNNVKPANINNILSSIKKEDNPNYKIIFDESIYLCDAIQVEDPLQLHTHTLTILKNTFTISNVLFDNFQNIFKNFSINISTIHLNICLLMEYLLNFTETFIIINVDIYHMDVMLVENRKIKEYYKINFGLNNLLQYVSKELKIPFHKVYKIIQNVGIINNNDKTQSIYHINVNFIDNIWTKSFGIIKDDIKNKYNIPIFINGLNILQPLKYFLTLKTKLNINVLNEYLGISSEFEYLYTFQYQLNLTKDL